jgi:glutathione S-transferase
MPVLYHLQHSPFSRRTRLALARKGVACEPREVGTNPGWRKEAQDLAPVKTLPVFVDGPRVLGDSTAITRWLDAAHPAAPRLWPTEGDDAFRVAEVASLVDVALDSIINVGTRYYALRENAAWDTVKSEMVGRTQRALDTLADRAWGEGTIAASGWSAADMWLYTAVKWLEGLPGRVTTSPNAAQIVALGGWHVPDRLSRWASCHRDHPDVRSLDA